MVSAQFILSLLPPVDDKKIVWVDDQSVSDIKKGMIQAFELDRSDYKKIYKYFLGSTDLQTCKNIWQFLRANVRNVTESDQLQTLRTPASLLETGQTIGADCKNYALFIAGILQFTDIPFAFRFCKYISNGIVSHHVFIVGFIDDEEVWIDPIKEVKYFDYRRYPDKYTDIKFNNMALVRMSGIGDSSPADYIYSAATTVDKTNTSASAALNTAGDVVTGDWFAAASNAWSLVQNLFGGVRDYQVWQKQLSTVNPDIVALTYLVYAASLPVYTGGNGDSQIARYSQYNELFGKLGNNNQITRVSSNVAAEWNAQVMAARAKGMPADDNNLVDATQASTNISPYVINGVISQEAMQQIGKTGLVQPSILQRLYATAPSVSATTINPATGTPTTTSAASSSGVLLIGGLIGAKLLHLF